MATAAHDSPGNRQTGAIRRELQPVVKHRSFESLAE